MTARKNAGKIEPGWFESLTLREPHDRPKRGLAQTRNVRRTRKPALLVVDNNEQTGRVLALRLKLAGFGSSTVCDAKQAFASLNRGQWDVVLADLRTCRLSGIDFIRKTRSSHPSVAIILLAGQNETPEAVQAMKEGADDCLVKPLDAKDLLRCIRRATERRRVPGDPAEDASPLQSSTIKPQPPEHALQSNDVYEQLLLALGTALDLRDSRTAGHSRRVCTYSLEIAQRLSCTQAELKLLRQGALLHDIGKLAIPDAILWKPGPLTPEEWTIMKTHVEAGYEMVRSLELLSPVAELILAHHERYDGTGYPRGLKGDEIPLCARIFAVADALDAMTTVRPYQDSIPIALAVEEIRRNAGKSYDPQVVEAFLAIPLETLDFVQHVYHTQAGSASGCLRKSDDAPAAITSRPLHSFDESLSAANWLSARMR
jgi:putative nucleotidyltransferase with HDIG domain